MFHLGVMTRLRPVSLRTALAVCFPVAVSLQGYRDRVAPSLPCMPEHIESRLCLAYDQHNDLRQDVKIICSHVSEEALK